MTLDPKLLLLGDFAENGSWWTGGQESLLPTRAASHRTDDSQVGPSIVNLRTPQLHWANIAEWYDAIVHAGERWREVYDEMIDGDEGRAAVTEEVLSRIERDVLDAQDRLRRHLLKIMENRLKRPGRPLRDPQDVRFLLLFLENPLFHGSQTASPPGLAKAKHEKATANGHSDEPRTGDILSGKHSGIIKRIIGLMCHSSAECHNHLVSWFARYSKAHFIRTKDIVANFLTYRLSRQNEKAQERSIDHLGGLVPKVSSGNSGSMASLHFELSSGRRLRDANAQGPRKRKATAQKKLRVQPDWQIAASARVLGLLFSANISSAHRRADGPAGGQADASTGASSGGGQIIPISDFYNTLLDYTDLVADYTAWQAKTGKFSFCQYPFLLSIWAKIQILEHEAGRRMEGLAMDAFFDSIFLGKNINQYFMLEVRRDCLVEDSLRIVSEVVGSGSDDIKKRLRVGFKGEEGIDIGGLRKEWFLLFVREVFSPDHGR